MSKNGFSPTPVMGCKKHGIQPIVRACEVCASKMVNDFAANQEHLKEAAKVLTKAADDLVKAGNRIDELEDVLHTLRRYHGGDGTVSRDRVIELLAVEGRGTGNGS